jgi:diguanylate cyclase (GGDEF)-like protein
VLLIILLMSFWALVKKRSEGIVFAWGKVRGSLSRAPWLGGVALLLAMVPLAVYLRQLTFFSAFILFCYLQIVGTLLALTYSANALVHFRGTQDRLTLMLALGFALAGLIETFAVFGFYGQLAAGQEARIPLAWMVGRTLLATLLLAALVVERRVPHSREPGKEMIIAFIAVGAVAYLTSVTYLGAPIEPVIHPAAWIARPWELLPAGLFLAAVIGYGRRARVHSSVFDRALYAALWLNVACHLVTTQSVRIFDAPFTVGQILKVGSYAVVLGGALLDNARLFNQVRELAASDSLTGLGNYRTFVHVLESEIQRSQRTGRSFALLLLDLDGLKQVNDHYGHLVGSRAICRLGNVLRQNSRAMDTASRYGGDEFAVVLPEAGAEAARSVGQRICERLASDNEQPRLTVSVGAAVYPQDGQTMEDLLRAADRALYGMKRRDSGVMTLARIAACM